VTDQNKITKTKTKSLKTHTLHTARVHGRRAVYATVFLHFS